jgi:hypothetical protein
MNFEGGCYRDSYELSSTSGRNSIIYRNFDYDVTEYGYCHI